MISAQYLIFQFRYVLCVLFVYSTVSYFIHCSFLCWIVFNGGEDLFKYLFFLCKALCNIVILTPALYLTHWHEIDPNPNQTLTIKVTEKIIVIWIFFVTVICNSFGRYRPPMFCWQVSDQKILMWVVLEGNEKKKEEKEENLFCHLVWGTSPHRNNYFEFGDYITCSVQPSSEETIFLSQAVQALHNVNQ